MTLQGTYFKQSLTSWSDHFQYFEPLHHQPQINEVAWEFLRFYVILVVWIAYVIHSWRGHIKYSLQINSFRFYYIYLTSFGFHEAKCYRELNAQQPSQKVCCIAESGQPQTTELIHYVLQYSYFSPYPMANTLGNIGSLCFGAGGMENWLTYELRIFKAKITQTFNKRIM